MEVMGFLRDWLAVGRIEAPGLAARIVSITFLWMGIGLAEGIFKMNCRVGGVSKGASSIISSRSEELVV